MLSTRNHWTCLTKLFFPLSYHKFESQIFTFHLTATRLSLWCQLHSGKTKETLCEKPLHLITLNGHPGPLWFLNIKEKGQPWVWLFFFFPLRFHISRITVTKILELSLQFSFGQRQHPTISTMHSMEQTGHAYLAEQILFHMEMSNIWQCILENLSLTEFDSAGLGKKKEGEKKK